MTFYSNYDLCPKCGNDNLDFGLFDFQGDEAGHYPVVCYQCGFEGRQWCKLTFEMWQEYNHKDGDYDDIEPYKGGQND